MAETAGMYLFDTDTIINIFKKKPSNKLLRKLQAIGPPDQHISTITISEIVYGAYKSPRPDYHMDNLQNVLLPAVNIVGFDSRAAYICGRLRAQLEKKGTSVSFADLQIGAIAMANELILISGNIKHFKRIPGLSVENWFK
jgi:predicted nucleic acid-binding protein